MKGKSIALLLDGWKSESCKEYIAIYARFYDDLFNMITKTISVSQVDNEKSKITTDNANNMIKSIKDLGNNISNVRCMNHSLQLSINEAIKKMS